MRQYGATLKAGLEVQYKSKMSTYPRIYQDAISSQFVKHHGKAEPSRCNTPRYFYSSFFLDALHTNQTVSHREVIPETPRQERTVTAILTRPLRTQNVSGHGQQSGRPGRKFRARVGHLRSLCQQLFINAQGKGTAPTLRLLSHPTRPTLRPLLLPHPTRPPLRKLATNSICHDAPRLSKWICRPPCKKTGKSLETHL